MQVRMVCQMDVIPVVDTFSTQDIAQARRGVEKNVLAKALNKMLNDHVFVHGNKTVLL